MDEGTTTRASLLMRVRDRADAAAWRQFESTYREMLVRFCRSLGVQHADTEDVIQIVFTKLVAGIDGFNYDRGKGRFRDYLFRCVRNALHDWSAHQRQHKGSCGVADEAWAEDRAGAAFEREWVDHHFRTALSHVSGELDSRTTEIMDGMLAGRPCRELAQALGMSEPAVYKAQQRVRDRLRELIAAQVSEEDGDVSAGSVRGERGGQ